MTRRRMKPGRRMKLRRLWLIAGAGLATLLIARKAGSRPQEASPTHKQRWMDPATLRPQWTTVGNIRMHARVSQSAGFDAPAVVLVHGSGLSHRYMIPSGAELTARFRVYLPDMPGYGYSDKPERVYDVFEQADWLVAWMDSVGLKRASFLGNSFGCQVIANLAARYPQRVERVLLQGPTTPANERSVFWQFLRWRQNQRYNPQWLSEVTDEAYHQAGWRRMLRSYFIQVTDRIEDRMPHIRAPVLVIRGSEDPIANRAWCEWLAALSPHGELAEIADVAHTLCFTAPQPLAGLTSDFVLRSAASS